MHLLQLGFFHIGHRRKMRQTRIKFLRLFYPDFTSLVPPGPFVILGRKQESLFPVPFRLRRPNMTKGPAGDKVAVLRLG